MNELKQIKRDLHKVRKALSAAMLKAPEEVTGYLCVAEEKVMDAILCMISAVSEMEDDNK